MDWDSYNRIWADTDLTPHEKLIMLALVEYKNGDTGQCNPSLESLRTRTGLSKTSLSDITTELHKRGKLFKRRTSSSSFFYLYPSYLNSSSLEPEFKQVENGNQAGWIQDSSSLKPEFKQVETKRSLETPNETPSETRTPLGPAAPAPQTYQGWHQLLLDADDSSKRVGILGEAFEALFPDLGSAHYPIIGKVAKDLNNVSVILRHFWSLSAKQVDCLDCKGLMQYILRIESNERSRRAGGYGEVDPDPSEQEQDQHFSDFKRV